VIEMRPPSDWIERFTTSMRRASEDRDLLAVEKPGRKIRLSIRRL